MIKITLAFGVSLLISLTITPIIIVLAKKYKIFDLPNNRSLHKTPIPTLGGVAIYVSAIVSILIFASPDRIVIKTLMILGLTIIEFMGILDDIKHLSSKLRLLILFLLATVCSIGFTEFYLNTIIIDSVLLKIICPLVMLFWIVGITNAINFVDGIDGLASYLSVIILICFSIILSYQNRVDFALVISLAVTGAVLGFIPYNRHKALIFMGDSGSTILGFVISFIAIILVVKSNSFFNIIAILFIIFIPLMEIITSILRRIIMKKSVFKPDKMHFHHLLAGKINNHIVILVVISFIQIIFGSIGILVFIRNLYFFGIVLFILLFSVIMIVFTIAYKKMLSKGLLEKCEITQ